MISIPLLHDFPVHGDEGIILDGAVRVLEGKIPYRDFWHITLPGTIWIYALIFKIFGTKFIVARVTAMMFVTGQCFLIYFIARNMVKNLIMPFLSSFIFFLYMSEPQIFCAPHACAIFFSLLAFTIILTEKHIVSKTFSGIFIALSAMCQQNIGFCSLLGIFIVLLIHKIHEKYKVKDLLKDYILISAGILLLFIPLFLFLYFEGALSNALYTFFVWPFKNYIVFNKYPYLYQEFVSVNKWFQKIGFNLHMAIDISPLIVVGFLPYIIIPVLLFFIYKDRKYEIIDVITFAIFLHLSVRFQRPDYIHLLFVFPVMLFLIIYSIHYLWQKSTRLKTTYNLLLKTIVSGAALLIFLTIVRWSLLYKSTTGIPEVDVTTVRGKVSISYNSLRGIPELFEYINNSMDFFEPIFVYHWSPVIYFFTGRKNPTPFDSYKPIYNTEEQMEEILTSIKLAQPQLIIKDMYIEPLPQHPNQYYFPNVDWMTLLDKDPVHKYIIEHYEFLGYIGDYKIYRRKD